MTIFKGNTDIKDMQIYQGYTNLSRTHISSFIKDIHIYQGQQIHREKNRFIKDIQIYRGHTNLIKSVLLLLLLEVY